MPSPDDITRWLGRLQNGDADALDEVVRLLYGELREMARRRMAGERDNFTLSATALVNEVYMKLARHERIDAGSRTRFFAIAARTMRRVLVDYARARKRRKRGGGARPVPLDDVEPFLSDVEADEVIALDAALERLAAMNPRAAEVVEQRFYGGMSAAETAQLLGISEKTVQRDWIAARAWLRKEVARDLER
jgi:RNA polymerase sigma factor (TIGR02999 family)